MKELTIAIALATLLPLKLQSAEIRGTDGPLEEVVVTGEQPGPSLWKVTSGDHTLWILGTYSPLPKRMKWRSSKIEDLIAHAQEVVTAGEIKRDVDVGFFETIKSVPAILRVMRNPDDATLADIIAPDVYAQWHELKVKYIGRSQHTERLRPVFALEELQKEAIESSDLSTAGVVWPVVRSAARKHHVKISSPNVATELKIDHASKIVANLAKLRIDDRECFATTVAHFEENLHIIMMRANAWAVGDIDALLQLHQTGSTNNCGRDMRNAMLAAGDSDNPVGIQELAEKIQRESAQANEELREKWLEAIELAINRNRTTFALLPIYDLVNSKGRLHLLRDKGYEITAP